MLSHPGLVMGFEAGWQLLVLELARLDFGVSVCLGLTNGCPLCLNCLSRSPLVTVTRKGPIKCLGKVAKLPSLARPH